MTNSIPYSPLSLIKNRVIVRSDNSTPSIASNSIFLIHKVCFVLTQYPCKLGNNLSYNIYIINNIGHDICNIKIEDILPQGVKFISTFVEKGQYKHIKDRVYYNISIIKAHSFCKIVLNLCVIKVGKKINTIKVTGKGARCTINNICKYTYY